MESFEEDVQLMMLWLGWQSLQRNERKMRVRDIFKKQVEKSQYYNLLQKMRLSDREHYFKCIPTAIHLDTGEISIY